MTRVPIRIPQMGEGLMEARIVSYLKRPGDPVSRDEPIFEMETDKAILAVEAPIDGVLEKWEAAEGSILPIGSLVAIILTDSPNAERLVSPELGHSRVAVTPAGTFFATPGPLINHFEQRLVAEDPAEQPAAMPGELGPTRNRDLSPRVRAYCVHNGITVVQTRAIPRERADGRLRIADVDRWLLARSAEGHRDRPLSERQKTLSNRLMRATKQAAPASIELDCNWDPIENARAAVKQSSGGQLRPSGLDLIAWCVTRAMENHPKLRSALIGDNTVREYAHVHLGIAVGLPDDELTTAALPNADTFTFPEFVKTLADRIRLARRGADIRDVIQLSITNMAPHGIRSAVPVVVPPAIATLFIGAPRDVPTRGADNGIKWERSARFVLNFDHRLINGVGGARFLRELKKRLESLPNGL